MNFLSADNISKSYSERWLFKNVTIGISQGDKIALVGINGAGKSTLLKTLGGIIECDEGKVAVHEGIRASYLPQEPTFPVEMTIKDVIYGDDNIILSTIRDYDLILTGEITDDDKMADIMQAMTDLDAWDYDKEVNQILGKLGLYDLSLSTSALSGGQKKRLALAQLLLKRPDLIILDEPTNHLDLEAIEWLENYLRGQKITLLMVTHDRYFLDNVTNQIIELENGKLFFYQGNYGYFLEKKMERELMTQATIDKAKNLYTKELDWIRRQPKARGTKAKYRVEAFDEIKEVAFSKSVKKELEINIQSARQGNKVAVLENVTKQYADKMVLENFSYTFQKRDRVGIVGKNGIGKSSFLNMLTGSVMPDSGEIVLGATTKIGYYTQEVNNLNPENKILEEVLQIAEFVTLGDGVQVSASRLLDMFLFPPAVQYTPISKLSGGERRRLQLLKVLISSPNFLILDEPTNDLDIDSLNVLEDFLDNFSGSLLLVSHDRYFMDRLVEHIFVFEGDGVVTDFPGNYTDFRDRQIEEKAVQELENKKSKTVEVVKPKEEKIIETAKKKLSSKEQKELETLAKDIEKHENEKLTLVEKMNQGGDHKELLELGKKIEAIEAVIEDKTMRWLELSE